MVVLNSQNLFLEIDAIVNCLLMKDKIRFTDFEQIITWIKATLILINSPFLKVWILKVEAVFFTFLAIEIWILLTISKSQVFI